MRRQYGGDDDEDVDEAQRYRSRQERGLTQADYEQAEERDADGDGDEEWEEGGDEDDVALHAMDTSPARAAAPTRRGGAAPARDERRVQCHSCPLVCKSAGFTRHENTHARDGIKRPEGWEVEDGKRAWAEGQAASAARGGQAAPLNEGFGLLLVSSKTRKGEEAGRAREGGEGMRGREERAAAAAETIGGRWSMSRPSLMRARKQLWRCCLS